MTERCMTLDSLKTNTTCIMSLHHAYIRTCIPSLTDHRMCCSSNCFGLAGSLHVPFMLRLL
jgi:hypothetical protein